ncbi:HNH endonuclease [Elizabethkingia anophelis]|nr:HNH endonuclease [Elizabethkingia anophelis]
MITDNPSYDVHLFTRTDNSLPFTYEGSVVAIHFFDTIPVKIVWSFKVASKSNSVQEPTVLYEGGKHQVVLNKYERNPVARRMCIEHYGFSCQVCEFNFFATYGELGKNFIHVHHIVPLAEIGDTYEVDPITDLIPVCPNCHAMIHRKSDFLSINDLKSVLFHKTD